MAKLTSVQVFDAMQQERADQIAWHKAKALSELFPQTITAYEAGFAQGWARAVGYLRLHGGIVLK